MGCCGGCSQVCKQLLLLLWKNFILQIRRPIGTAFEVILPILAVILIVALRVGLFSTSNFCFVTFDSDNLEIPSTSSYNIFYTPNTGAAEEVAAILRGKLPSTALFIGFGNETAMVQELQQADSASEPQCFIKGAGIVFEELQANDISYKIRLRHEVGFTNSWDTDVLGPNFDAAGPRIDNNYLSEGFLHLQKLVGAAIIEWRSMERMGVSVSVRQFPYPPYVSDPFLSTASAFLPILLVMAFLYSAGILVKELVLEKETRIRESMLMMGLKQWVLWTSWYIKQFVFLLISVFIISILIKAQVFPNSNFFLILVYFVLFILSMISFCFFVSVWFDSSCVGFIVGFVAWLVNYFPFLFLPGRYKSLSLGVKVACCLLSNTCLGLGVEVMARLEIRQEGLTFANFASPVSADDSFNMAWVFGMLLLDSILYMVVAWYVNAVKPGQYGVPKPFYFPFLPSYWYEGATCSKVQPGTTDVVIQENPSSHEDVATDLTVGISIRNLTKIYSQSIFQRLLDLVSFRHHTPKRAVDNLNLNMYKGQITALLGHNGAGKTTTMSILTGLYTPTFGSAEINGFNILSDMDSIRHSLGICPQHNVLFDRLTVSEHLAFFTRLKGIYDRKRVNREVVDMIADLQLEDKAKIQSSRLSGGMKRKLSIGIALIGGSEMVILDEPTSGMDPYARRATWDLLIKHKQNRTVLLTTQFMDEADILGDRIAIMAEGKLCCSGSSLFLKSRYGVGYHMTIVKEPTCIPHKVEDLLRSFVADAEQVTNVGAELSFILPATATTKFPDLFDNLEGRKAELGISSFSVSVTTMDEVFMKVRENLGEVMDNRLLREDSFVSAHATSIGKTESRSPASEKPGTVAIANLDEVQDISDEPSVPAVEVPPTAVSTTTQEQSLIDTTEQLSNTFKPNTGITLWVQQFCAMFLKRFYNSLRFYGALVSQLFLPLLFVLVVAVTVPNNQTDDQPRALRINNSGLSPDDAIMFFSQFQNIDFINLSTVQPSDVLATEFLDYTDAVRNVMKDVPDISSQEDCCNYPYQILDKFCATRTARQLEDTCGSSDEFGYSTCPHCLTCCYATSLAFESCSRPLTLRRGSVSAQEFCPSPPSVSVASSDPQTGLLDSMNTYVAEHIITTSVDIDQVVFFRRYLAGISITAPDPVYSVCDCQGRDGTNDIPCIFLNTLSSISDNQTCDNQTCEVYSSTISPNTCPTGYSNNSNTLCTRTDPGNCYSVNALVGDSVRMQTCSCSGVGNTLCANESASDRLVSTSHPEQPTSPPTVTVWYNNDPYHVSPAALNAFHNIYLQQVTGQKDLTMTVINHPLPRNSTSQLTDASSDPTGFGIAVMVIFGLSFLLSSFVLFVVSEKESKAKHLQFVSGVSPTSYWLASFAWDLINASIPVILATFLFLAFQVEAFTGSGLGAIFVIMYLTCWAGIPLTYMISFVFSNSLAAFGVLMLFFFTCLFGTTIVFLVRVTSLDELVADILHYIFLLAPTYGLGVAINDIFTNQNIRDACERIEMEFGFPSPSCDGAFVDNLLSTRRPGVGVVCIYLFMEGIVFFLLTLLIQVKFFYPDIKRLLLCNDNSPPGDNTVAEPLLHGEDTDVQDERKKVISGAITEQDVVVIKNLVKVYSSHLSGCSIRPPKRAVGGITLAIPKGECFGLLGVNGAGKTTTFSILTGDNSVTSGTAVISGHDIRTNIKDVQQRVGYCPQFDALIERLTGRELLTMFARLRGIPEGQIKEVVATEIKRLDFPKHADKRSSTYSGGNKRKLSIAIALVGNPPIVMLDEPTTGMDPNTRRYLWDVLTNITKEGRSIILTSHSMEECEALCTRLAIMVNGTFKCLGSTQHLKNKFGSGFTLQAKVKLSPVTTIPLQRTSSHRLSLRRSSSSRERRSKSPSNNVEMTPSNSEAPASPVTSFNPFDTSALHSFIKEAFRGAILMEEHQGAVTYRLPSAGITWSTIFRQLETNKERLAIVDYSVSQTTLDQVFINFAKEQHEE